ncbi:hypothetical protein [Aeromonas veronii]|uniref:hypothetical protein n=1 Tax=Aeromonas veronii TaxID=654 RepID=UPI003D22A6A6
MAKIAHWRFDIAPVNGLVFDEMSGASGLVATWDGPPPAITIEGGLSGVRVGSGPSINLAGSLTIQPSKGVTIAFKGMLEANQGWGTIFGINNGSTTPVGDSAILLSMPLETSVATHGRIYAAWKVNSNDYALGGIVKIGEPIKCYAAIKSGVKLIECPTGFTRTADINAATPTTNTYTKGKMLGRLYTSDSPIKGFFSEIILFDHFADFIEVFSETTFKPHQINAIPANQEPRSQFQPQDVAWRGTPTMWAGPVNLQQQTQYPLCKGRDYFWIRDGVRNVEQGYIESTVTISGVGVRRRVLCFTQDGELVGETYSRASDGVYRFDLLWLNKRYMLVAQDDPAFGPADYNAVAADYQAPKPYPPGGGVAPAPFPMLAPLKRI